MIAYRYSAPAPREHAPPEPDTIMDELARHVLERDSLDEAMLELGKRGIEQKYDDSIDGLDRLASKLLERRRKVLDRYTVEPLLERLSRKIRSILRRETEALRRRSSSRQKEIDEMADKFLKKAANSVKKMERMREGSQPESAQTIGRLENAFEKLFLQRHKIEAESRALREEEAHRLKTLKQVPRDPGEALKKLQGYEPVDPEVAEALASLGGMADEIGAIERTHAQPGFAGSESVDLDEAAGLVRSVRGMERLGGRLRKGSLSPADESLLADTLGPEALACVDAITMLERELLQAGYLEADGEGVKLSPRAIRRIGRRALDDVFSNMGGGRLGGHGTLLEGAGELDTFNTKAYGFGNAFNLHVGRTLMNALARGAGRLPIDIDPRDFEVYTERHSTDCSSVLLLDLSHTMSRNSKLQAAKKVTLALDSLIRTRFPRDTLRIVGFSNYARELTPEELPFVSIDKGSPFTNMQDGLRLAGELVCRDRGKNRQIILITDGEPSAFCRDDKLHVGYPPTEEIFGETLREATRLTRKGVVINTFMLDEQPPLVRFVEEMTAINRGRAFFSVPERLGEYLLVDYLARRRRAAN